MTDALCLGCGEIKHGALCDCSKCGEKPTGNSELDIAFSDHLVSKICLQQLGDIKKEINKTHSGQEAFWIFIKYISDTCPEILSVKIDDEHAEKVNQEYRKLSLPKVKWEPGFRNDPDRKTNKNGCLIPIAIGSFGIFGSLLLLIKAF